MAPHSFATACYKSYMAEGDYHFVFAMRNIQLTFRNAIPIKWKAHECTKVLVGYGAGFMCVRPV